MDFNFNVLPSLNTKIHIIVSERILTTKRMHMYILRKYFLLAVLAISLSGCSSAAVEPEPEPSYEMLEELIKQKEEELRQLELEEQKRQEELEKQRLEYANLFPYEGMDETFIDDTMVGLHQGYRTSMENDSGEEVENHYYYWYVGKDNVLRIVCRKGKVFLINKYQLEKYWDENGMPIFDNPREVQENPEPAETVEKVDTEIQYPYDPYDVYDFKDPDDFADEWAEEFGDGDFEEGYDDAFCYWEDAWSYIENMKND